MSSWDQGRALAKFLTDNELHPDQVTWGKRVIVFTLRYGPEILQQGIFFRFTRLEGGKRGMTLGVIPEENETTFGEHLDAVSRFATDETTSLILPAHLVEDRQSGEQRTIVLEDDFRIADGEAYAIWSGRRNLAVRLWHER